MAVRGADLAHVSVMSLVGSERRYWGAVVAVAGRGVHADRRRVVDAVGLDRRSARASATKYAAPATRRSIALREDAAGAMLEEPADAGDVGADDLGRA